MLWELFHQPGLHQATWNALDAKLSAREAQVDARQTELQQRELKLQVDRLTLAAMAMAEILRDRLGVSEHEIEAKITEIDLRDGQLDGKVRAPAQTCGSCQRRNGTSRRACLYCGADLDGNSFLFGQTAVPDSE